MIPLSGSINVLSTVTLNGVITGSLSYTCTNAVPGRERELIITGGATTATAIVAALAGVRVAPFLYLNGATNIPAETRIIATESPTTYTITSFSWTSGTLTINTTIPVATVIGQKVTISGSSVAALNGTFTATNASTTAITVSLASDPGTLTSVVGFLKPGIVDVAIDGTTVANGKGYYTINANVTGVSTNAVVTNTLFNAFLIPNGTTHVIPTATTATNTFGNLVLEGVGSVTLPCLDILSFKNLVGGKFIRANGTASTDIQKLVYCNYNPFGYNS